MDSTKYTIEADFLEDLSADSLKKLYISLIIAGVLFFSLSAMAVWLLQGSDGIQAFPLVTIIVMATSIPVHYIIARTRMLRKLVISVKISNEGCSFTTFGLSKAVFNFFAPNMQIYRVDARYELQLASPAEGIVVKFLQDLAGRIVQIKITSASKTELYYIPVDCYRDAEKLMKHFASFPLS